MLNMNKNNSGNVEMSPSPRLVLLGALSGGLTIVLSIVYATLSSLAIHFRTHCDAGIISQSGPGSKFFLNTLLRLYFKQDDCSHALTVPLDVTKEQTIFALVSITLTVSLVCLLLAVAFIVVLNTEPAVKFIEPLGYCYVASIILSMAIDLAMAIHFGMDHDKFTQFMNNSSPGVSANYVRDMYRLGALLLLIVSLKGGIIPVLNIVFVSLIILCLVEFRKKMQNEEHFMHNVGALRAFDQPRRMDEQTENSFSQLTFTMPKRNDDQWQNGSESTYAPYRGTHLNPMFVNEEPPRTPTREPPRSDYANIIPSPSFDRSYSWHHSQPLVAPRPFSYLEDIKRQPALKSPSTGAQWQRDPWDAQAPPVPAPDYSPDSPRRLKSVLKSSYM